MKSLLMLVIVATAISSAVAVRCYQCESLTSPDCGMEFKSQEQFKFDCDRVAPPGFLRNILNIRNATGCMKKVLDSVAGHPQIVRTCYFGDLHNTASGCMSDPSIPFVKELSCSVCAGDLCNSSTTFGPVMFMTFISAVLAYYFN